MPDPVSTSKLDREHFSRQLLEAISVPVPRVERSGSYSIRMFWALLVMLAMIAIYSSSVIGLFVGVFYLFWSLLIGLSRNPLTAVLFVGVPLLVVVCVLAALIKPLFARSEQGLDDFELQPEFEPLLFDFIARLCNSVGAPSPSSIVVDANANAGASFISGVFDRRLRLTLGLPLVLGLDTRQLAGVIAHEFAHFSQTSGMLLTYLIRRINDWFTHAAFERDAWDNKLKELSEKLDLRLSWALWLARTVVFAVRLVLIGLVLAGHFFCSGLLREMEFDADRYEARLAGSQNFARTCRQLKLLELCQSSALEDLDQFRRESRLPDNLPALIVSKIPQIPSDEFRELEHELLEVKTGWADSHPSDRDRIENAAREQATGIFQLEHPSGLLFTDVKGLCRVVTLRMYRFLFGDQFDPGSIQSTDEIVALSETEQAEGLAALRFVMEQFCGFDTFQIPRYRLGTAIDANQFKQNINTRRQRLLSEVCGYALIRQQEDQISVERIKLICAKRLIEAGFDLSSQQQFFGAVTLQQVHLQTVQNDQRVQQVKTQLKLYRQVMGHRLLDALEFVRAKKIVDKIGEKETVVKEVSKILTAWENVIENYATFEQLLVDTAVTAMLLEMGGAPTDIQSENAYNAARERLYGNLTQIHMCSWQVTYPFVHGKGEISLAYFLLAELPSRGDMLAVVTAASELNGNLDLFLRRCVTRLGSIAEKVEHAFGFEPLKTPPEAKLKSDS